MKFFLPILAVLILFEGVLACSFIGFPDPPLSHIISKFDTIYIGTVVSKKTAVEKDEDGDRYRVTRMKIKVEKVLKGAAQEFREIATYEALVKDTCSDTPTEFKVGEKWIFHQDFDRGTEKRRSEIGFTFRSARAFDAEDSPEYITEIEKYIKNPVTAIHGQMETRLGGQPYKEVEVFLEGNGLKTSTRIDKNGRYSFENIPAGNYRVQIRLPVKTHDIYNSQEAVFNSQTQTFNIEYELAVKLGGSDYHYIVFSG